MTRHSGERAARRIDLNLTVLVGLLIVLAIAGGASRAGELGQIIVRCAAIGTMLLLCLTRRTWNLKDVRLPLMLIALIAGVALVQLVPLPPALWTALPGRSLFLAAVPVGLQPWRPINLTPDAGLNSLLSLSVPVAVLTVLAGVEPGRRRTVIDLMLAVVLYTALLGTLQLTGGAFASPLINNNPGEASGLFANRNHQALMLAIGMPLLAVWAFRSDAGRARPMRWLTAAGAIIWLLFLVLATGSRAGLGLAVLGLVAAAVIAMRTLRQFRLRGPRWALPVALAGGIVIIALVILVGLESGRAESMVRLMAPNGVTDVRLSSQPLLWEMVARYFPFGSGFGSFDPVFRIIEPFDLLKPTYFNHAHNDGMELLIEGGVAGGAIICGFLFVWIRLGLASWRGLTAGRLTGFAGWSTLTLMLVASFIDYPARTPMMMAIAALAAWLVSADRDDVTLPA